MLAANSEWRVGTEQGPPCSLFASRLVSTSSAGSAHEWGQSRAGRKQFVAGGSFASARIGCPWRHRSCFVIDIVVPGPREGTMHYPPEPWTARHIGRARRFPDLEPHGCRQGDAGGRAAGRQEHGARAPAQPVRAARRTRPTACCSRARRRQVVYRGKPLMSQGEAHHGICLIESGVVRSFYVAPTGRVITLAYRHHGNFVGGPQIYGGGEHLWSAVAVKTSVVLALSGRDVRELMECFARLLDGNRRLPHLQGQVLRRAGADAGTRSASERSAQLLVNLCELYGVPETARESRSRRRSATATSPT